MSYETSAEEPVEVPYQKIDPSTLRRLVEDLVTRDGTDYGAVEKTLDEKVAALMRELESGRARLAFDLTTETIGLLTAEQLARATRGV